MNHSERHPAGENQYAFRPGRLPNPQSQCRPASADNPAIHSSELRQSSGDNKGRHPCATEGHHRGHGLRRSRLHILTAITLAWAMLASPARPEPGPNQSDALACQTAMEGVATDTGVPKRLLEAIAPVESGLTGDDGQLHPWPWTVNVNGYGSYHFRSRKAAERYISVLTSAGIENIDIGCMQINLHWHRRALPNPTSVLSPEANLRYAALMLRQYRSQTGSWAAAVGRYHSRNPHLVRAYQSRIAQSLIRRSIKAPLTNELHYIDR
jgi:Transglycosylase SLT domain